MTPARHDFDFHSKWARTSTRRCATSTSCIRRWSWIWLVRLCRLGWYDLEVSRDVLHELARRYVWWLSPTETLARPNLLLCQLMQLGTAEDVRLARDLLGDDAFRDALRMAPPGIFEDRSWNFWHLVLLGRSPPPLPSRPLPP